MGFASILDWHGEDGRSSDVSRWTCWRWQELYNNCIRSSFFFSVSDGRLALVCQANSPLDDTAKLAHTVLRDIACVVRATSHSHYNKLMSLTTAARLPWHQCLATARDGINIPDSRALLLATTAIVAMTRQGAPVLPEQFADFVFQDESQCQEGPESMMLPSLRRESGMIVYVHDDLQTPPHEPATHRNTQLGRLTKFLLRCLLGHSLLASPTCS
jgi:hypothetical protein